MLLDDKSLSLSYQLKGEPERSADSEDSVLNYVFVQFRNDILGRLCVSPDSFLLNRIKVARSAVRISKTAESGSLAQAVFKLPNDLVDPPLGIDADRCRT